MRKLGRPTDQRLAMLRSLTTDLFLNGRIITTTSRAKELKKIADSIISLAIKEKDNYEEIEKEIEKAKLDSDGNKVTKEVTSKNGKKFNKVVTEKVKVKVQKDMPSRLAARRKIMKKINKVEGVDILAKLFDEIAENQEGRIGGYTRIVKLNPRQGDSADMAVLEIL